MARVALRGDEVTESLNLIDQLVLRLPGDALVQHVGEPPASRWWLVESARGLLTHWIRFGDAGEITDWRMRSASHANWPAVDRGRVRRHRARLPHDQPQLQPLLRLLRQVRT